MARDTSQDQPEPDIIVVNVRWEKVREYERRGWVRVDGYFESHHTRYGIWMRWAGEGDFREQQY